MSSRCLCWPSLPILFLALAVSPVSAAEADKYLPEDTGGLISINVKQVVDSPLFKKTYLPVLQKELNAKPDALKLLRDVGIDPFRDIDRLVVVSADSCAPKNSNDAGVFVILHGRFDPARIQAKIAEVSPYVGKVLQIHKAGNGTLYEVTAEDRSFFFALADRTTAVFAARREPVSDALDRAAGKKKGLVKDEGLRKLIAKADAKQALWVAANGHTTVGFDRILAGPKPKGGEMARRTLGDSGISEVTGGFWVTDGLKAAFGVEVQDATMASAVGNALQNELGKTIDKGFDGALDGQRLAPVREFLKEMVISGDGKHVVIQSEVAGRVFVKSLK